MPTNDDDLFSPGAQISQRMALERRISRQTTAGLNRFLASARDTGKLPLTITLLDTLWQAAMEPVIESIEHSADKDLARNSIGESSVPMIVLGSLQAVRQEAAEQKWSDSRVRSEIDKALDPNSPRLEQEPDEVTASLVPAGMTMAGLLAGIAVGVATGIAARTVMRRMSERSRSPKFRWITRRDDKVRPTHAEADGQVRSSREYFLVGGEFLEIPGDPNASLAETANCRCVLVGVR